MRGRADGAMRFPGTHVRGGQLLGLRKNTNDIPVTARTSIGVGSSAWSTVIDDVLRA